MIVRTLMAWLSLGRRSVNRLLGVFADWFGTDKVQTSVILFGAVFVLIGVLSESLPTAAAEQGKAQFVFKAIAVVFVSIGTSVIAAGIIFRVIHKKDRFHESLEKAGVLFVGDRNAFDEVIGWDNWIRETHRCSELI